jgi:HSP20 family protein
VIHTVERRKVMSETQMVKKEPQSLRSADRLPTAAPPVDVYENDHEILLVADLPGVAADTLEVGLDNGELLVEAPRTAAVGGSVVEAEYGDCRFQRRFALPAGIDAAKVTADLRNGVLELHLPKAEAVKPRRIEVRAG